MEFNNLTLIAIFLLGGVNLAIEIILKAIISILPFYGVYWLLTKKSDREANRKYIAEAIREKFRK